MNDSFKDRVTIYEVASVAGVSLATVSRVINNHQNVTEATRQKVKDAINKLGYRPSALAQALATSKTTNIGVIIPSANYVYISNLLHGITKAAGERGYVITLFVTSNDKAEAKIAMDKLITSHVDGAIIFDNLFEEEEINQIANYQVPVVVVNNRIDEKEKVTCITFGYENTLREEIVRKHLQTSSKPMFFVDFPDSDRLLDRLKRSFVDTHEAEGRPYTLLSVDNSYQGYYDYFLNYFKAVRNGYFIVNRDTLAVGVINAAHDNGLRVPEDIEVLSLIGTRYAPILRPRVSNMLLDLHEVGLRAMDILVEIMGGKLNIPRQKVVATYVKLDTTL